MPKEKETGWVVELRGYTYHKRGPQLRRRSPGRALARAGVRVAPAARRRPAGPAPAAPATPPAATDPVVGHISHVVLYKVDDTGRVDLRHTGYVAGLTARRRGAAPGAGPGGGGMAGR